MLCEWFEKQRDPKQAINDLKKILIDTNNAMTANEVIAGPSQVMERCTKRKERQNRKETSKKSKMEMSKPS